MKYKLLNPERARTVGDDVFILTRSGDLLILRKGSAVFLWQKLLSGAATIDELVAALGQHYEVNDDAARADVASFLKKLSDSEMLDPAIPPAQT